MEIEQRQRDAYRPAAPTLDLPPALTATRNQSPVPAVAQVPVSIYHVAFPNGERMTLQALAENDVDSTRFVK